METVKVKIEGIAPLLMNRFAVACPQWGCRSARERWKQGKLL